MRPTFWLWAPIRWQCCKRVGVHQPRLPPAPVVVPRSGKPEVFMVAASQRRVALTAVCIVIPVKDLCMTRPTSDSQTSRCCRQLWPIPFPPFCCAIFPIYNAGASAQRSLSYNGRNLYIPLLVILMDLIPTLRVYHVVPKGICKMWRTLRAALTLFNLEPRSPAMPILPSTPIAYLIGYRSVCPKFLELCAMKCDTEPLV
jgi:hypothetical protein